nr:YbdD/YjiX family protein [Pseudonocardia sp. SID8383]
MHGWWRGVIGADLYDRYLDHHRRSGHDHPPMTEREYWRARTAYQESNPQGRCC